MAKTADTTRKHTPNLVIVFIADPRFGMVRRSFCPLDASDARQDCTIC
jgi:hypothetical protein